jgi:hypothetical protein
LTAADEYMFTYEVPLCRAQGCAARQSEAHSRGTALPEHPATSAFPTAATSTSRKPWNSGCFQRRVNQPG